MNLRKVFLCLFFSFFCVVVFFMFYNNVRWEHSGERSTSQEGALSISGKDSSIRVSHAAGDQVPVDAWDVWLEQQVDLQTEAFLASVQKEHPYYFESVISQVDVIKSELGEVFAKEALSLKEGMSQPPPVRVYDLSELSFPSNEASAEPQKHEGPQTVDALLGSFEDLLVYPEVDVKYPQSEWVEMLLSRGVVIEDFADYSGYLSARQSLVHYENNPFLWQSGETGILPTEDWETFKASFIDRHIWQYQQLKTAVASDPEVNGGIFVGAEHRIFLPLKPGRVYVSRFEGGAFFQGEPLTQKQEFDLLCKGIHPEGYDIVYLNENDAILSEAPPPITRQQIVGERQQVQVEQNPPTPFLSTEALPFDEELVSQKDLVEKTFSEPSQSAAAKVRTMRKQEEKNRMARSEAELEKLLTSAWQGLPTDFPKELNPQRVEKALIILQRYGFEEGLQRIQEKDREVASHLERLFLSKENPTQAKQTTPR